MIGVYVQEPEPRKLVQTIANAEKAGVPSFWLTMGGTAPDVGIIYGEAAMITDRIKLVHQSFRPGRSTRSLTLSRRWP